MPLVAKPPLAGKFRAIYFCPVYIFHLNTGGADLTFGNHILKGVQVDCAGDAQCVADIRQASFKETGLFGAWEPRERWLVQKEEKINDAIIENVLSWHHSGFNVYIGDRIEPDDKSRLDNLARYIIRACF